MFVDYYTLVLMHSLLASDLCSVVGWNNIESKSVRDSLSAWDQGRCNKCAYSPSYGTRSLIKVGWENRWGVKSFGELKLIKKTARKFD